MLFQGNKWNFNFIGWNKSMFCQKIIPQNIYSLTN